MTTQNKKTPAHKWTLAELRALSYLATLLLAAVAIIFKVDTPVVWAFLGMAIGSLFGGTPAPTNKS